MDTHAAPQQSGVAGLHGGVDGVLDHYGGRRRVHGFLSNMERLDLGINGRQGLGFVDEPLGLGVPWLGGEQRQRGQADVRLQRFPGLMAYRACRTSCTKLFDFSGLKATISLSAATMIQNWAEERNSRDMTSNGGVLPV